MRSNSEKTRRLVGMSIFTALVVVLQVVATFVRFGPFSITLALTPIVIGAAMFGPRSGAWLGGVFGVVVLAMCVFGADWGGAILWNANPLATAVLCILKGAAAGLCASLVYSAAAKKNVTLGVTLAAVVSPIVNTGIFVAALALIYPDTLAAWAGAEDMEVIYYLFFGLTGVNFLVELVVNAALSPVLSRIIKAESRGWMK